MKVRELIDYLENSADLDDEVVLASDPEGNRIHQLHPSIGHGFYRIDSGAYGLDYRDAEEKEDGMLPCISLWPR